jgi:hypothetical protein
MSSSVRCCFALDGAIDWLQRSGCASKAQTGLPVFAIQLLSTALVGQCVGLCVLSDGLSRRNQSCTAQSGAKNKLVGCSLGHTRTVVLALVMIQLPLWLSLIA